MLGLFLTLSVCDKIWVKLLYIIYYIIDLLFKFRLQQPLPPEIRSQEHNAVTQKEAFNVDKLNWVKVSDSQRHVSVCTGVCP